jgi:cell division transport system ATP-binding protein
LLFISNLTLSHRELPVLRNATVTIRQGEVVVLTGETGAGKTTFLRALYGDLPVNSGRVVIDGVELHGPASRGLPKLRRRMGLIFQDDKLLDDRSVYDNIRFALSIQMDSSREVTRRALEVLAELGLSHLRSQMPTQLSAGEAQRIGIARALANDPNIIIADEPTGDLDAATAREIFRYLASRYTPEKVILIATHDPGTALEAFPNARQLHLKNGKLLEV